MLKREQRLYLARHLLSGIPGLEDRVLNRDLSDFLPGTREALLAMKSSAPERILGLAAMDILDQSGGTLLGDAIRFLDQENLKRFADVVRTLA